MKGDWGDDYIEATYVPGPSESFVLMGAQVGWSPAREARADDATGHCPLCRTSDALDGDVRDGTDFVCAKCQRWGRDPKLASLMLDELISRGTLEPELRLAELPADAS